MRGIWLWLWGFLMAGLAGWVISGPRAPQQPRSIDGFPLPSPTPPPQP